MIGGPVGDKIGRKYVIWGSILGVAPFTLILPYASLHWTGVLTVIIGFILASAFSAILVYAQELLPGRIGMVSGLFFGFAFGMGGLGAAVLGLIADHTSIELVYKICAFLPLLGMLTIFLPDNRIKTDFIAAKGKLWLHRFTVAISLSSVKPPSVFRSVLFFAANSIFLQNSTIIHKHHQ